MGEIGKLFKDILVYGSGRVLIQLIGFLTIPILTRLFSVDEFGIIETVSVTISTVGVFATLALESATQRSFFDYRSEEGEERRRVISTSFWFIAIWSTLITLPLIGFDTTISKLLFKKPVYSIIISVALLSIPASSLANFSKEVLRLQGQSTRYSTLSVITALFTTGLGLIFVLTMQAGIFGFYLGTLLGNLLGLFIGLLLIRNILSFCFSYRELKKMLAYGLPLVPTNLFMWVLMLSDRFFLLKLSTLKELGLYAVGNKVANLLLFVIAAFSLAWAPFILSIYSEDQNREKEVRGKLLTYFILVMAWGAILCSLFVKELLLVFTTKDYVDAHKVVGILTLGVIALGSTQFTAAGISLARQTKYFALYSGYAAGFNLILNILLIPPLGMVGAGIATALSLFLLTLLYYRKSQEVYYTSFELQKVKQIITLSCALIGLSLIVNTGNLWTDLFVKLVLMAVFIIFIYKLQIVGKKEIGILKDWAKGLKVAGG